MFSTMFVAPAPVRKSFTEVPLLSLKQSPTGLHAEAGTVNVTSGGPRPFGASIVAFKAALLLTQAKPMTSVRSIRTRLSKEHVRLVWLMMCGATCGSGRHELAIRGSEDAGQGVKLLVVVKPSLNM